MNSSDLTKLAGGFLGTVFVLMTIGIVSDAIFAEHHSETEGYAIEVASAGGEGAGEGETEAEVSILPLIASANPDDGVGVFKKCAACHTTEEGGANKVGPNLWNIVNRAYAAAEGFGYSSALTEFGADKTWTYDELDKFLKAPKKYVKGTAMGFAGVKKDEDRAALIGYLRTLSASPPPLPAADGAGEAASETAAADTKEAETASAEASTESANSETSAPAAEAPAESTQMASAGDPAAGEKVFRKCKACHTAEEGGANKIGPNLWDIIGKPVASAEGFKYSNAMQEYGNGKSWSVEELSAFIQDPKGLVKGTKMSFAGIKKAEDLDNLIAYLGSLSAN